jgi:hypothetical protein
MELIVAFFFYLRNTKVYIDIKLVDKAKKRFLVVKKVYTL